VAHTVLRHVPHRRPTGCYDLKKSKRGELNYSVMPLVLRQPIIQPSLYQQPDGSTNMLKLTQVSIRSGTQNTSPLLYYGLPTIPRGHLIS
jgi:hypothetical protein